MNPGDGVVQNSDGSWTATVNGNQVYNGPDNQAAQNAFISGQGSGNNQTIIGGQAGVDYGTLPTTAPGEGFDPAYYAAAQAAMENSIQTAYNQALLNTKSSDLALQAAQQRANDLIQYARDNGDLALKAFAQVATTGVDIASLLTKMQGPSNAFAYDRAMQYLGNSGLGGALGAVTGNARPAQFGLMGPTQSMSFDTLNQGLGNTQGGPSIMDELLGLGNTAWGQYTNATNNELPFSLPQFSYNQNPQQGPNTPPGNAPQTPAPSTVPAPSVAPTTPPPTTPPPTTPPPATTDTNGPQVQQPGTIGDQTQQTQQNQGLQNQTTNTGFSLGPGWTVAPGVSGPGLPPLAPGETAPPPGWLQNQDVSLTHGPSYAAPTNPPVTDTGPGFGIPPSAPTTNTGTTDSTNNPAALWMFGGPSGPLTPAQWKYPGYSATGAQYLSTLPDPSQMNATNFFQLPKYSQDLMLSGYQAKGYDPNQLTEMWQGMLPGKAAGPSFGLSS